MAAKIKTNLHDHEVLLQHTLTAVIDELNTFDKLELKHYLSNDGAVKGIFMNTMDGFSFYSPQRLFLDPNLHGCHLVEQMVQFLQAYFYVFVDKQDKNFHFIWMISTQDIFINPDSVIFLTKIFLFNLLAVMTSFFC